MSDHIKGKRFIIFGEDYNRHPHALEHILRPLFHDNSFLWVQTIGLRSPKLNLYDLKRIKEKINQWLSPHNKANASISENVFILSPFMIPFSQFKIFRWFNKWSVRKSIKTALSKLKGEELIVIASVPNACDYFENYGEHSKIYFCVDDFSLWPGLNYKLVKAMEDTIVEKADLVIGTSEKLCQEKRKKHLPTVKITHGVEFNHFKLKKKNSFDRKICYFGLFDDRTNQDILEKMAMELSAHTFHIYGDVVCDVNRLKSYPNIYFHGKVAYANLPQAIEEMDAFILPYKMNELTASINPLKLKEYLLTGRPVITTPLPEVLEYKNLLYVGESTEEFINHVRNLNAYEHPGAMIQDFIQNNETWDKKAKILGTTIATLLERKNWVEKTVKG